MSQLTIQTRIRLPKIQEGLREGLSHEQIASNCGVTRRTIERDLESWYESGEFETWLKAEFVELYEYVRTANPTVAFKELARLMGKMVTRKAEIKSEYKAEITHKKVEELNATLADYRDAVQKVVDRHLQTDNT
jgi:hypothetical protein